MAGSAGGDPARWRLRLPRDRELVLDAHPRVMGVLNLTPDSFSDGGRWLEPERAVAHAREMLDGGAQLLDLGAESTRPAGRAYGAGAPFVSADEELRRLLPVLGALRAATDAPLSVDTRKGEVARAALAAGADLVNDVSGGADPELLAAVVAAGCPLVLMHSRGDVADMHRHARYDDVVAEVRDELAAAMARAEAAGVARPQIVLDPGLGFAKTGRHNLELLRRLDVLQSLGRPLLVGASRKSFLGEITGQPPAARLAGSLAAAAWSARAGVAMLRVHDVAETAQLLAVWAAIEGATDGAGGARGGAA